MMRIFSLVLAVCAFSFPAFAERVGEVSTTTRIIGPNDKIVIEAFHDPKVSGVTCHLSRAERGGLGGAVGLAEDTSDGSIACRQTGPIVFDKDELEPGEEVFKENTNVFFKAMRVVRFYDEKNDTLVYLVYSRKLIDGSPKNAISTVPVMKWSQ